MQPPAPTDVAQLRRMEDVAATHLARVAAELVLPSFGGALGEHHWASHSQVHTAADARAGAALRERFRTSFPDHSLLIEDLPAIEASSDWRWYIDPIDGSANHLRGIPYVALTAGLCRNGEPVVGVVHDLLRGVTFSACAGGGVRRRLASGGAPTDDVRVADTTTLRDAMLIAHLSRRGPLVCLPGALQHLLWHVRKIRCMGSIALDLALLAAGEADLLVVGRGAPQRLLDIMGGLVVLREAGGAVMTAAGTPVGDRTRTLVAGPEPLCRAFVELMAGFDLEGWRQEQAQPPAV
ncbi:MAG TPA: inositol monophosphatase family protein [Planctomycetota bacterium]|nr:inositol monophosphatase family protein [Planctomycetota bacterium]